jgi:hypothetical protein
LEARCGTNAEERGPNGAITQMLRALERADQAGFDDSLEKAIQT